MLRPIFFLQAKWKLFLICIKGNDIPSPGSSFFPYPAFRQARNARAEEARGGEQASGEGTPCDNRQSGGRRERS